MSNFFKRYFAFRFQPTKHTGFALGTLLLLWVFLTLGTLAEDFSFEVANRTIRTEFLWFVFLVMLGSLFVGVYVPVSHVTKAIGQPLNALGMRRDNVFLALGLSIFIGAWYVQPLLAQASDELLQHLLFNALFGLWQVIFVHGWLQLRYERAFGAIPAILLTAASYMLLQVNIAEPTALVPLLIVGLGQAFAFSIMRSIFVVWPIPWAVSYSIVTLQDGLAFGWGRIFLFAALAILIYVMLQWVYEEAKRAGTLTTETS